MNTPEMICINDIFSEQQKIFYCIGYTSLGGQSD